MMPLVVDSRLTSQSPSKHFIPPRSFSSPSYSYSYNNAFVCFLFFFFLHILLLLNILIIYYLFLSLYLLFYKLSPTSFKPFLSPFLLCASSFPLILFFPGFVCSCHTLQILRCYLINPSTVLSSHPLLSYFPTIWFRLLFSYFSCFPLPFSCPYSRISFLTHSLVNSFIPFLLILLLFIFSYSFLSPISPALHFPPPPSSLQPPVLFSLFHFTFIIFLSLFFVLSLVLVFNDDDNNKRFFFSSF